MLLHGLHLSSATLVPARDRPPTIRIPQAIPQTIPQVIPQVIPQAIPQVIPLSTVAIQAPIVPQWRQRLDDVTILYNTVTEKLNGDTLSHKHSHKSTSAKGCFREDEL